MPASTARGSFPYPLGGDAPDTDGDLRKLAERIAATAALYLQGLGSERPAAGVDGRLYLATDTGVVSYDTGTAWTDLLTRADASAAFEAKVSRTGAAAGQVPALQGDGSLAFRTFSSDVVKVAETVLGAAAASVTFSAIPGTYRHLWLVVNSRSDAAAAVVGLFLRLNGDTTASYDFQRLFGSGTAAGAEQTFGATSISLGGIPAGQAAAGESATTALLVPNYAATALRKNVNSDGQYKIGTAAGNLVIDRFAGFWRNAAAVTSVVLFPSSGSFVAGTTATLYGVK